MTAFRSIKDTPREEVIAAGTAAGTAAGAGCGGLEVIRLADCGLFPLKKAIHGELVHTLVKARWKPVEDYLRGQGRYAHLFQPERREARDRKGEASREAEEVIRAIQTDVDHYWRDVKR